MEGGLNVPVELDAAEWLAALLQQPQQQPPQPPPAARPQAEVRMPPLIPELQPEQLRVLDLKNLARLERFTGEDAQWFDWKFGFLATMELLQLGWYLRQIETMQAPINFEDLTPEEKGLSRLLYSILVYAVGGAPRARSLLRLTRESNGFETWRQLLREYEPQETARHAAMLAGLLRPRWTGRTSGFMEELRDWELAVLRYEEAARAAVPDCSLRHGGDSCASSHSRVSASGTSGHAPEL